MRWIFADSLKIKEKCGNQLTLRDQDTDSSELQSMSFIGQLVTTIYAPPDPLKIWLILVP